MQALSICKKVMVIGLVFYLTAHSLQGMLRSTPRFSPQLPKTSKLPVPLLVKAFRWNAKQDHHASVRSILKDAEAQGMHVFRPVVDALGQGFLFWAVKAGSTDYLDSGLDVSKDDLRDVFFRRDERGYTLFLKAVELGHIAMVEKMLTLAWNSGFGPEVFAQVTVAPQGSANSCLYGRNALHIAVRRKGKIEMVKRLLEIGLSTGWIEELLAAVLEDGTTPLMSAVRLGRRDCMKMIIDAVKKDVSLSQQVLKAKDRRGFSPLRHAVLMCDRESIQFLLEAMINCYQNALNNHTITFSRTFPGVIEIFQEELDDSPDEVLLIQEILEENDICLE